MAVDDRNKRGSAIGIGPASPVLPNPDGAVDAGDRAQLAHAYRGFFSSTVVSGTNTLFPDTDVEVVKLTLKSKTGGSPATYYLSRDHFYAGALYASSPMIYPLLAASPTTAQEVGRYVAVRSDTAIQVYGKSDFTKKGYTFADTLQDYEFHDAQVEVRYYAKPAGSSTTHADAVNIRWTGTVIDVGYDDATGIVTINARETWFKDKDFGHRFVAADFSTNTEEYRNKWVGDMAPLPIGPLGGGSPIVSSCPLHKSELVSSGGHTRQRFYIITSVQPPGIGGSIRWQLYAPNPQPRLSPKTFLPLRIPGVNYGASASTASEFSGKTWRLARKIDLRNAVLAEVFSGVTVKTKRVGQINADDGKFRVFIQVAKQISSLVWNLQDSPLYETQIDPASVSTTAGDVYLFFDTPPILPPGYVYFVVVEWTRHRTDDKIVDYATFTSPIEITTTSDHGWATGDSVTISGVIGCTAANGRWTITVTAANKFTLNGSTGNGTSALPVTNATKRRPIEITTAVAHGLVNGDEVRVSGVEGNTAANGTFQVLVTSPTTFLLVDSVGNGTYASGGSKAVSNATNAVPIVVTTSTAHGLEDNDIVQITGVLGNTGANGVWRITKLSSTTFSLDGSAGTGAYTSGGTVSWGGVVEKKATAERNKYLSLYTNPAITTDPTYANDPSVEENTWTETAAQLQLRINSFDSDLSTVDFAVGNYVISTAWVQSLAEGVQGSPFGGIDFKAQSGGITDTASGTYTGTPSAPLDDPAAFIKFILMDATFGLGLTSSQVDTAAIDAVRTAMAGAQDMVATLEKAVTCEDLIKNICEQARLVLYKTRTGKITLKRPTYPAGWTSFKFQEGALRGDMRLVSVADKEFGDLVNAIDVSYAPDSLQEQKDPYLLRTSKDARFTGLEFINESNATTDLNRSARAAASQALYGKRYALERADLYYAYAPVRHAMAYKFDRYKDLQKRVTVRLIRKDYYAGSLDLFSAVTVSHSGIRAKSGTSSDQTVRCHYQGTPIKLYSDGVPVSLLGCGTIRGEVVKIAESGPFLFVTVETVSPYPSVVIT